MFKTLLLLLALAVPLAHAERIGSIMGIGATPCGDYVAWRESKTGGRAAQAHALQWTWGYISAHNLYGTEPQVTAIPSPASIGLYLEKYCREHPLDKLITGVVHLMEEINTKK